MSLHQHIGLGSPRYKTVSHGYDCGCHILFRRVVGGVCGLLATPPPLCKKKKRKSSASAETARCCASTKLVDMIKALHTRIVSAIFGFGAWHPPCPQFRCKRVAFSVSQTPSLCTGKYFPVLFFKILSALNQVVPNHLVDESQTR